MKKLFSKLLVVLLAAPLMAMASEDVKLDKFEPNTRNYESLQRGAKLFVNYCLNCHSAAYMRYNRLQDIGLTEQQIKDNFLFSKEAKIGDLMKVSMTAADGKTWLGAPPPDLTVIARSRGADWLYTYLRGFYRDETRPTGWNNTVFDKVGMPHVLYELQGDQVLEVKKAEGEHGHEEKVLKLIKPGSMTSLTNGKADTHDYDQLVGDLVNYLVYMGEPSANTRETIGYIVLLFLILVLVPLTYALKQEYWKDVH
ncbi:ubiquinol-cytochrome c reductase cytochrome c1 subunit [Chitinivorax tropicus]|uniref:Ubiquinol-cytochrome c reductase cytochrome c1 subunit n=1 Tax=Chitinivorax tropicus TaxID=714531 RepID=A0A840MIL8_9PROT|nr:cytochrome c1 [Chitinivorax tropicus]MBB5019054.1 ubiquinol-cytochrome c reductase cytochrome c1 subunit [Chitinivorax tropicus]